MSNLLILIIDDSVDHITMMKEILERLDYRVITASNGAIALNSFTHNDPDVIITDIRMPEMDGEEVMSRIRTHQYRGDVPIVAITAHGYDRGYFIRRGFDDFISKPFSIDDIRALMSRISERIKRQTKEFPHLRYTKQGEILDDDA